MIADILVSGVPLGCLYALVAVSYNILYRPTNVFNFAQGDLVMLGALITASLLGRGGIVWPLALLAAIAVVGLTALVEEIVAVSPILRRSSHGVAWVITTLAFSLIVTNLVGKYWGADPIFASAPWPLSTDPITVYGVQVSTYQIALVAITAVNFFVVGMRYCSRNRKANLSVAPEPQTPLFSRRPSAFPRPPAV